MEVTPEELRTIIVQALHPHCEAWNTALSIYYVGPFDIKLSFGHLREAGESWRPLKSISVIYNGPAGGVGKSVWKTKAKLKGSEMIFTDESPEVQGGSIPEVEYMLLLFCINRLKSVLQTPYKIRIQKWS